MTASATALYVRVSTADQRTDSQTEDLEAFCQARGYSKIKVFDERESGETGSANDFRVLMPPLEIQAVNLGRTTRSCSFSLHPAFEAFDKLSAICRPVLASEDREPVGHRHPWSPSLGAHGVGLDEAAPRGPSARGCLDEEVIMVADQDPCPDPEAGTLAAFAQGLQEQALIAPLGEAKMRLRWLPRVIAW